MSIVRFAMLCDKCGSRSKEYGCHARCKDCDLDICGMCDEEDERTEDEANKTLCHDCQVIRDQEARTVEVDPRDTDDAYEQMVEAEMGCL